jgi:magnesium-transporting ATPase (P-type)
MVYNSTFNQLFEDWNLREVNDSTILLELKQNQVSEDEATAILKAYKKTKTEKRQTYGFVAAGIGAFFCMFSCVFTLLGILPELRGVILYGLTTVGIMVIVAGLYLIFED